MSTRPSPLMAKTFSTMTAPLISSAKAIPITVTTGMSALRNACLTITTRSGSPLARATWT